MYDKSKSELENIFNAIEEQTKELKSIKMLLQEQLTFWHKIENGDYYNEVMKKEGIKFPQ